MRSFKGVLEVHIVHTVTHIPGVGTKLFFNCCFILNRTSIFVVLLHYSDQRNKVVNRLSTVLYRSFFNL
jgi:hypothetical protein